MLFNFHTPPLAHLDHRTTFSPTRSIVLSVLVPLQCEIKQIPCITPFCLCRALKFSAASSHTLVRVAVPHMDRPIGGRAGIQTISAHSVLHPSTAHKLSPILFYYQPFLPSCVCFHLLRISAPSSNPLSTVITFCFSLPPPLCLLGHFHP